MPGPLALSLGHPLASQDRAGMLLRSLGELRLPVRVCAF